MDAIYCHLTFMAYYDYLGYIRPCRSFHIRLAPCFLFVLFHMQIGMFYEGVRNTVKHLWNFQLYFHWQPRLPHLCIGILHDKEWRIMHVKTNKCFRVTVMSGVVNITSGNYRPTSYPALNHPLINLLTIFIWLFPAADIKEELPPDAASLTTKGISNNLLTIFSCPLLQARDKGLQCSCLHHSFKLKPPYIAPKKTDSSPRAIFLSIGPVNSSDRIKVMDCLRLFIVHSWKAK